MKLFSVFLSICSMLISLSHRIQVLIYPSTNSDLKNPFIRVDKLVVLNVDYTENTKIFFSMFALFPVHTPKHP